MKQENNEIKDNKAKFENTTDADNKSIISLKVKERLQRQKQFRELYLARRYKEQILKEIDIQVSNDKITYKNGYGIEYSKELLICERMIVYDMYVSLISEEKNVYDQLLKDGLTKEDIDKVLSYEYKFNSAEIIKRDLERIKKEQTDYNNSDLKKALDAKEKEEQEKNDNIKGDVLIEEIND